MKQRPEKRAPHFGPAYRVVVERVAANVRRLREARGWTQEEAAHQCGELDATLYRVVEAARSNITASTVARICEGFDVDVSELYAPAPPLVKRGRGRPRKPPTRAADRTATKSTEKQPE